MGMGRRAADDIEHKSNHQQDTPPFFNPPEHKIQQYLTVIATPVIMVPGVGVTVRSVMPLWAVRIW
jgi:hypothetical protein